MDPGVPVSWKLFHAFNTLLILYPSFVTAFTIVASLEISSVTSPILTSVVTVRFFSR